MKGLRSLLRVVGTTLLMTGLLSSGASVSLAAGTLDWQFWDFFNVPPGEYFDIRSAVYQETPIGAECWYEPPEGETGYCTPNTADSFPDYARWH